MPPAGSNLLAELERLSLPIATWLLTYAIHSTLLLGIAWLVCRLARLRSNALKDLTLEGRRHGGHCHGDPFCGKRRLVHGTHRCAGRWRPFRRRPARCRLCAPIAGRK